MQKALSDPITVTKPLLPPFNEFLPYLEDIWKRKSLSNNGYYHKALETALCDYLKVPYISLLTNGTVSLIAALKALCVTGEVITTPFSFVATSHVLLWHGLTPVFVDVEEETGNLNPEKIEAAITPQTTAIMPVHVYGRVCDTKRIQEIADKYNLKVIYDAAHAFGVEKNGQSVLTEGDLSSLSFHATKTYNTIEGGALVCHNYETKMLIDRLKNFGFAGETTVVIPGINGKMDEIHAAYGLLNLQYIDKAIEKRRIIAIQYRTLLKNISGICYMNDMPNIKYNYTYFPIFVDQQHYGMSRDALYDRLKQNNIYCRRYFYPLISSFPMYKHFPSANPANLPVAHKLADTVLCLPIYDDLDIDTVNSIAELIRRNTL